MEVKVLLDKELQLYIYKSAYEPKWPIRPELILVSVALSD